MKLIFCIILFIISLMVTFYTNSYFAALILFLGYCLGLLYSFINEIELNEKTKSFDIAIYLHDPDNLLPEFESRKEERNEDINTISSKRGIQDIQR